MTDGTTMEWLSLNVAPVLGAFDATWAARCGRCERLDLAIAQLLTLYTVFKAF